MVLHSTKVEQYGPSAESRWETMFKGAGFNPFRHGQKGSYKIRNKHLFSPKPISWVYVPITSPERSPFLFERPDPMSRTFWDEAPKRERSHRSGAARGSVRQRQTLPNARYQTHRTYLLRIQSLDCLVLSYPWTPRKIRTPSLSFRRHKPINQTWLFESAVFFDGGFKLSALLFDPGSRDGRPPSLKQKSRFHDPAHGT